MNNKLFSVHVTKLVALMMAFIILLPAIPAGTQNSYAETSEAWDGTSMLEPKLEDGTYQISSGAELAWLAAGVNDGSLKSVKAELINDIDLSGHAWTPIGGSTSNQFDGTFDGKGFRISGLLVNGGDYKQAGLFGYVKAATIKNFIVDGEVNGTNSSIGGIVSKSQGATTLSSLGAEVNVTNSAVSGKAAGIAGWADDNVTIEKCYNRGDIVSGDRASGIVADTGTGATITDCYNTGSVSGNKANGIGSSAGISYTNCYNAGQLTGTTSSYGIGASNYADYNNTFILEGSAASQVSTEPAPAAMTSVDMKKGSFVATLGSTWKADVGGKKNKGYPLLSWEKIDPTVDTRLEAPSGLEWSVKEETDLNGIDMLSESYKVTWSDVTGASGYIVKLYRDGEDSPVFTSGEIEKTEYDLYDYFASSDAAGRATYHFTVTAKGDGTSYTDSAESAPDSKGYAFDSSAFIASSGELMWNEASKVAVWKAVPGATGYIVTLYNGNRLIVETKLDKKLIGSNTGTLSAYFLNNMAGEGEYYFTVRAIKDIDDQDSPNYGKVVAGKEAVSDTIRNEQASGETIKITSLDQWMAIVNMTCAGTEYLTDADRQRVEWSKNYVLETDLDFSKLNTEQSTQTKSWGNVDARFTGTFDGQGHKITGLTLSNHDAGLFEYIGKTGVVKNLTVVNANLLVSDNAAVFAHYNYGKMLNCHVRNTNITTDYAGVIGPMASRNFGTIEDCTVQGGKLIARTETSNGHSSFVGNNSGIVKRCWTSMDVTTGSYNAGGFCGWSDQTYDMLDDQGNYEDLTGKFEDCFALGNVTAKNGWSGAFVGRINSSKNTFKNCYAAGSVSSELKPERCYGFTGSFGSEGFNDINGGSGAFVTEPTEDMFDNCYYASDMTDQDNPKSASLTVGKPVSEMRTDAFRDALGLNWSRDDSRNSGLPYLSEMPVPEKSVETDLSVKLAIATYDKSAYEYSRDGEVLTVNMKTTGNTCVIDVMDEAVKQGLMTYDYTITPAYGSFIEAINGNALSAPDGWMFTVNDTLSDVSASIAKVEEGDQILWYQGTTQNLFAPPSWNEITGEKPKIEWELIRTPEDLVALTADDADLTKNYRLANDIDMQGVGFQGIGKYGHAFSGVFDGAGHTVSNVTINRPEDHNIGFFNFVRGAVIKDIILENVDIKGKYSVGGMIGVADAEVNINDRTKSIGNSIGGCRVSGKVTSTNEDQSASSDGSYAGGFIGFNNGDTHDKTGISVYSSIDNCEADVKVMAGSHYSGGFAGGNYGYITNSKAKGDLDGAKFSGGFAGGNEAGIYDSSATGNVTGSGYTGGFVGSSNGTIQRCYSTGNVTGSEERIGGFTGSAGGTIKNSLSAGTVDAGSASYVGGFAGYYIGMLSGLPARITFAENSGWCIAANGSELPAIGNKKSSTVEAEQASLDYAQAKDWSMLQDRFLSEFGVILTDQGDIVIPKRDVDLDKLARSLYENLDKGGYSEETPWILSDMIVYEKLTGTETALTGERKQAYIDSIAEMVQERDKAGALKVTSAELSKAILSLRALGYDPRKLVYKDEEEKDATNLVAMLKDMVSGEAFDEESVFVKPYILLALSQDENYLSDEEAAAMVDSILGHEELTGGFGSADATGPAVMALAKYKDDERVSAAIERALSPEKVISMMDTNGAVTTSFSGSAGEATVESTAQMIIAMAAAGKDPEDYKIADASIIDGLKAFVDDKETGFEHNYNRTGSKLIASEQGYRGILASMMAASGGGILYDFSGTGLEPAVSQIERAVDFDEILKKAREDASKELDRKVSELDIPEAIKEEAEKEVKEAKEKLSSLEDLDSIDKAVNDAVSTIEQMIETQLEKEKAEAEKKAKDAFEKAKKDAGDSIEAYFRAKGDSIDKAKGISEVMDAVLKISDAKTVDEINRIVADAKAKIDSFVSSEDRDIDAITPSDATLQNNARLDGSLSVDTGKITTTAKMKKKQMTVKWKAVTGAVNYRIAYKKNTEKKWTEAWTKGKTNFVMKGMKKNGLYEFRLMAVKKVGTTWAKSGWSKDNLRFFASTGEKVKAGKKRITVRPGKVKKASGYDVVYSLKKNGKEKIRSFKGALRKKAVIKRLKSGKKYYVRIRPYKMYKGRKYTGILSKAKRVKVR